MVALIPHVLVIALENHSYTGIIGNSNYPLITALSQTYGTCTNFYAISHPSLPNYLAFASGDNQGVCDDHGPTSPGIGAANIFSSLDTAGIAWKCYCESIPSAGYLGGDTGQYAARHNPVVYFRSFRSQTVAFQQAHLVAYPALSADLTAGSAPPFCFVVPNVTHDGHSDPSNSCDGFVSGLVSTVQASTWYTQNNGIIVLWWDEDHPDTNVGIGDQTACSFKYGGHIACVVISAANHGIAPFTSNVNHYGFLYALEKLYGLPLLGKSAHPINGDLSPLLSVNISGSVSVSPSALTFNAVQGGSNPPSQAVQLKNTTGSAAAYTTVSSAPTWLAVSPTSGSVAASGGTATSTISVTTGSLAAGTYSGTITYSGAWGSLVVNVSFVVATSGSVSVSPSALTFNAVQGGSNPLSQNVTLSNTTGSAAAYSAVSSAAWLSVSPASGSVAGSGGTALSTISATLGTRTAGTYSGTITYSGAWGSVVVNVSLVVAPVGNATTSNLGNGFRVTAPADTNPRTLKIYTDVNQGIATLAASLSDSSAPDFYDSTGGSTATPGVYTLSYQAASPGQTLSVFYTLSGGATVPTVISADTFTRANQSGLGTASGDPAGNETYQLVSEAGSPAWSIVSNQGKLTGSAGDTGVALLGSHTLLDCEAVTIVNLASTACSMGLVLRSNSAGTTYYRASLWGSAILLYYVTGGVSTQLAIQPATFKTNTNYWLRFRACKSSLYAKYWPADGSPEPKNWSIFASDTTLATAGKFGFRGMIGAASDSILFDTFSIVDLGATGDPSYVSLYAADLPTGVTTSVGSLSVATSTPTGTIDLTTEGIGDWAHWGYGAATGFDHKAGVVPVISNFTNVGGGTYTQNTGALLAWSWEDGTPDTAVVASTTETTVTGAANGYSFTVPADTTSRTLNVYVAAKKAQGTFTAMLSDGSAAAYSDASLNDTGTGTARKYAITYNAATANQTLTITWTMLVDNGTAGGLTTYSTDSFIRANQSGWGSASDGTSGAWVQTNVIGSPTASITSNKGVITSANAGDVAVELLGSQVQANAEVLTHWQMSNVNDAASALLRATATNTFYRADASGGNLLSIARNVAGSVTILATVAISYAAATAYQMRFRIDGSNLYVKHWLASGSEPSAWTLTYSDTSGSAITGAGKWGLRAKIATASSTVSFDTFSATNFGSGGGTPGSIALDAATTPDSGGILPPPPPPPPASTTRITVNAADAVVPGTWIGLGVEQDAYSLGTGYAATVLSLAPLRYYHLEISDATIHDLGSQGQDGTPNGGVTPGQPGCVRPLATTAMSFDGATGYISLPTTGLPTGASAWSMGCWVKFATVPGAGQYPTIINLGNGANGKNVAFYFNGDLQQFSLGFQGLTDIFSSVTVTANHIYCLAGTYNGTTGTLYCYDATAGTSDITSHAEALNLTYGSASIGVDASLTLWFPGIIDEPAIYGVALSAAQAAALYTAGTAQGVTTDQRALINARLNYLNPPIIRTAAESVSWWCPSGVVGTYDFTNALMQEWYAVFDNAEAQGFQVILAVNSPFPFTLLSSSWCTAFADLVDYLINTLGYTCIRYVSGVSEPDTH